MAIEPPVVASQNSSFYRFWYRHFLDKRDTSSLLPWDDTYILCARERRAVVRSIQQFQVGEWARGRGLVRRASSHPIISSDRWFLASLELFISEEQHHSSMLGCFLDHQRIPKLGSHWVNRVFRRLRKLAGLEVCVMVLVTAEVLAVPFYSALRDATRSRLLRSICARILHDEAAHLNYQALTLGLIRRSRGSRAGIVCSYCHPILFHCTALVLWQQHHRVFHAAGWDFYRFWNQARRVFVRLQRQVRAVAFDGLQT